MRPCWEDLPKLADTLPFLDLFQLNSLCILSWMSFQVSLVRLMPSRFPNGACYGRPVMQACDAYAPGPQLHSALKEALKIYLKQLPKRDLGDPCLRPAVYLWHCRCALSVALFPHTATDTEKDERRPKKRHIDKFDCFVFENFHT